MIDVDAFLAHHGVKGQRWGIRNKRTLTRSEIRKRNHRRKVIGAAVRGGLIGGAAAAATSFIAIKLIKSGSVRINDMHIAGETTKTVADVVKSDHAKQLYSLTRMHAEGKMNAEQFANFKRILDLRYDRKLFEAGF